MTSRLSVPELKIPSKTETIRVHIGVLGDSKCGKSSLISCFLKKTFNENKKENTILSSTRTLLKYRDISIDLVISEIDVLSYQKENLVKKMIKTIDVFFICHEIAENDDKFNEEIIRRYITYVNNVKEKDVIIYIVGCKLDAKKKELKEKIAYIYDNNNTITNYGQRVKTFVLTNNIQKFYLTSALLNYNITELFLDAIATFGCYSNYIKRKNGKDNSDTKRSIMSSNEVDNDICIII